MEFVPIEPRHYRRLAEIHAAGMPNAFLPSLGTGFLEELYRAMFGSGAARGAVAVVAGEVVGFCYYTADHATFFRRTLRHGVLRLGARAAAAFMRRPALFLRMLETFRYQQVAEVEGVDAEIYAWAVDPAWRRQRVGWNVLDAAEAMMQAEGIPRYKHTVYEDNDTAIDVYARRGHERIAEFVLYGKRWALYRVDFARRAAGNAPGLAAAPPPNPTGSR